ncbi:MAG TPA: toll/interleukin-1 receptor domain-containing protein [Polyangiaceae bacterium]|nr:toll/interleukin-1 receptor domain-containing protein [Polyangiaceae bacterium]
MIIGLDDEMLTEGRNRRVSSSRTRSHVFICYSHKDVAWRDRLRAHLELLEGTGVIAVWDDTRIKPGTPWEKEIRESLSRTRVAVLLVSADFLASSFIQTKEIPALLAAERDGATVIPIIVAPCLIDNFPEITRLQSANSMDRSLVSLSPAEQEKVFVDVAKRIEHLISVPIAPQGFRVLAPWLSALIAALISTWLVSTHEATLNDEVLVATQVVPVLRELVRCADDLNTASAHYPMYNPRSKAEFHAQVTELNGYIDAFNTASAAFKAQRSNFSSVLAEVENDNELTQSINKVLLDSSRFSQDGTICEPFGTISGIERRCPLPDSSGRCTLRNGCPGTSGEIICNNLSGDYEFDTNHNRVTLTIDRGTPEGPEQYVGGWQDSHLVLRSQRTGRQLVIAHRLAPSCML